jgi:CRP-like cAMP-binding protein
MLEILANKAFFLNRKLQILSSTTLRQKIAKTILQHPAPDGTLQLSITREAFADYLGVARPSLSRELMKMKKEGMLTLDGKKIIVDDIEKLIQVLS